MLFLLGVLALATLLAPPLTRRWEPAAGWLLALAPAAAFVRLATALGEVSGGNLVQESVPWVPALGVEIALRLDGLSLLFGLLITGIGTLVILYAGGYLQDHRHLGRFYAYLLLFMTAMLGLVLADDFLAMFVFWELTSLASFLLISFKHEKPVARRAALQALLVTGGGGLALLAGLLLLGTASGAWTFSGLEGSRLDGHPLHHAILGLILLGCFTKSAQVPFHLWLPNAMNAPTPVSAYLHSATMVKAGVYLLARLNPVLGGEGGWGGLLAAFGAATALVGALLAVRQTDMKRLLAYTTVVVLGQLTMLLGTGTNYGLQAFVILLLAHSLYKGALFMGAGAVEQATGTREIPELGGLFRAMPLTGAAIGLAAFSNGGLPPFFGFIAKEFKYAGLMEMGAVGWGVTTVMVFTNALLLASAGLVFLRPFLGPPTGAASRAREVSPPLWVGPLLLAVGGLVLGYWHHWPERALVNAAVRAVAGGPVEVKLYLWGGLTPAVGASLLTLLLGGVFYANCHGLCRPPQGWWTRFQVNGDVLWDRGLEGIFRLAGLAARPFQHGSLRLHLALLAAVVGTVALLALAPISGGSVPGSRPGAPLNPAALVGCLLALAGAGGAALMRERLAMVASLGASGLGLALFFLAVRAPDVAATQFLVETLTVVLLALVLRGMASVPDTGPDPRPWKLLHVAMAVLFGVAVGSAVWAATRGPLPGDMARWYLDNAYPAGRGGNVVNVILVDFRAFDTLGEILVVALAALAAGGLLDRGPAGRRPPGTSSSAAQPEFDSVLVRQAAYPLAAVLGATSLWLLWRGHYLPGGGFIGGLVAASGLVFLLLTFGRGRTRTLLRARPASFLAVGLALAAGAGLFGLATGRPFLTAAWATPGGVSLGTPLLFDVGVFLTVLGAVLHISLRLAGERGD